MTFRFTLNTQIICVIYTVGKTGCYKRPILPLMSRTHIWIYIFTPASSSSSLCNFPDLTRSKPSLLYPFFHLLCQAYLILTSKLFHSFFGLNYSDVLQAYPKTIHEYHQFYIRLYNLTSLFEEQFETANKFQWCKRINHVPSHVWITKFE